jgi:hypothetical protein
MVWPELIGGFLLFLLFLGGAHALDRHAAGRFGYRPLALPNLAFMLIPHGALAVWALGPSQLAGGALPLALAWVLGLLGCAALILMLVVLYRRTSPVVALAAAGMMLIGAPVLLLSMLFRDLAESALGR